MPNVSEKVIQAVFKTARDCIHLQTMDHGQCCGRLWSQKKKTIYGNVNGPNLGPTVLADNLQETDSESEDDFCKANWDPHAKPLVKLQIETGVLEMTGRRLRVRHSTCVWCRCSWILMTCMIQSGNLCASKRNGILSLVSLG